jgi:hypothetical protein
MACKSAINNYSTPYCSTKKDDFEKKKKKETLKGSIACNK